MLQIRKSVFETNSSSSHVVSIVSEIHDFKYELELNAEGKVEIEFGTFGCDHEEFNDSFRKLQYLLTMAITLNLQRIKSLEDFYLTDDFLLIESTVCGCVNGCKGIEIHNDGIKELYYEANRDGETKKYSYMISCGGIDHQSYEHYSVLFDFLNDWNVDIESFIFDRNIHMITKSDSEDIFSFFPDSYTYEEY